MAKAEPTESKVVCRANPAMQPSVNAALVIAEFGLFRDLDVVAR